MGADADLLLPSLAALRLVDVGGNPGQSSAGPSVSPAPPSAPTSPSSAAGPPSAGPPSAAAPTSFRAALTRARATRPGAALSIPASSAFRHVRPSLCVAESGIAGAGLGLFTSAAIGAGELVGFYTGVWAYESDVDATFAAREACVQGYVAKWSPWVSPKSQPVPHPTSGQPVRSVDRLYVLPRINAVPTPGDVCSVHYAPSAAANDVLALANHAAGTAANIELASALLPAGTGAEVAALPVFAAVSIAAGAELLMDYGYEPTSRAKFKPHRRRPLNRLHNLTSPVAVAELRNQGIRTQVTMQHLGLQLAAVRHVLGPTVVAVEPSPRTGSVALEVDFPTRLRRALPPAALAAAKAQLRAEVLGA